MKLRDVFLWSLMGMMLVIFFPIGLLILSYIIIKTANQLMVEEKQYKQEEYSYEVQNDNK